MDAQKTKEELSGYTQVKDNHVPIYLAIVLVLMFTLGFITWRKTGHPTCISGIFLWLFFFLYFSFSEPGPARFAILL